MGLKLLEQSKSDKPELREASEHSGAPADAMILLGPLDVRARLPSHV